MGSGSGDQGSSLGLGWPLESGATARGSQDWLYFFLLLQQSILEKKPEG